MNKKLVLKIINGVLIVAALALIGFAFVIARSQKIDTFSILSAVAFVITLAFAGLYLYMGFNKNAAVFYKGFMWGAAFYYAFCIASILRSATKTSPCLAIPVIASFVLMIILAVAKDYSRKSTMIVVIILAAFALLPMVYCIIDYGKLGDSAKAMALVFGARLALTFVTGTMVLGKYQDKIERGRDVK